MDELKQLVIRSQAGELDAYGEIVRRFQDMAYGYAYSVLGDFHLAEDAAQEAFIEAYRCLGNLRKPAAFPGFFRRIVFKHCDRMTRRQAHRPSSLAAAAGVASTESQPDQQVEDREMKEKVLAAIRSLPDREREVTTLFYINGYSQNDIAEFLEVPAGTVKSRLHSSRTRLKERMLNMVTETLHNNAPNERFSRKVIGNLLGEPRLLKIEGHPIRQVLNAIKAALPEYQVIETDDVMDTKAPIEMTQEALDTACSAGQTYHPSGQSVLRTSLTWQTLGAAGGQTPPIRILLPGRVFNATGWPGADDVKIGHVCDLLCITLASDMPDAKAIIEPVIQAILGETAIRAETDHKEIGQDHPIERLITFTVGHADESLGVCRGGLLTPRFFREIGLDADAVGGIHFGFGLDRLAMAKLGIDDIRKLWQPPYVP